jgi:hypothetical protein
MVGRAVLQHFVMNAALGSYKMHAHGDTGCAGRQPCAALRACHYVPTTNAMCDMVCVHVCS